MNLNVLTWDEALNLVASKFSEIRNQYGGEALAGFACSRSTNEDIYMLQKMVRTAFKSNNTDNCARVDMLLLLPDWQPHLAQEL